MFIHMTFVFVAVVILNLLCFYVNVRYLSICIAVGIPPLSVTIHCAKQMKILDGRGMVIVVFLYCCCCILNLLCLSM